MWTVWIIAAGFAYIGALAVTLAFVASAARGRERWERGVHGEVESMHEDRHLHGFRRVA